MSEMKELFFKVLIIVGSFPIALIASLPFIRKGYGLSFWYNNIVKHIWENKITN